VVPLAEDRRPAAGHPRPAADGLEHEAALIAVRQRWMAASSRSLARRSGFWQLHPSPRRIFQTWAGW
jgi:hypothetical protein